MFGELRSEGVRHKPLSRVALRCGLAAGLLACAAQAQMVSDVLAPYADRVESAINRGLAYLASIQSPEGYFDGAYGRAPAVVAFAGMAFLAQGHTPGRGPYGENLNRCIDYILSQQRDNGYLVAREGADRGMYSHNSAALFLCEVSGMVDAARQARLDAAISKALKLTLAAQNIAKPAGHAGGWRYDPGSGDSDMSLTGWGLMALRSARLNGARIPDDNIERAIKYVLGMQSGTGSFGYQGPADNINLTGAGVLCLELCGYHGTEQMQRAADFIAKNFPGIAGSSFESYALYYNSQAAFQIGGTLWQEFAGWMYQRYLPLQQPDGAWRERPGTWMSGQDQGTAYPTAMRILAFAVPYRQLPIYARDETVDEE